jgi:hypothetical protein
MSSQRILKIKQMNGDTFEITVDSDIKIQELRKKIQEKTSIDPAKQRLIYKAKLLKDEIGLNEYVKEDNETVHLIQKVDSSQPSASTSSTSQPQPSST